MEIALYFAVPVLAVIALLWVVNRRNPGNFGMKDPKIHDKGLTVFLFRGKAPNRQRF